MWDRGVGDPTKPHWPVRTHVDEGREGPLRLPKAPQTSVRQTESRCWSARLCTRTYEVRASHAPLPDAGLGRRKGRAGSEGTSRRHRHRRQVGFWFTRRLAPSLAPFRKVLSARASSRPGRHLRLGRAEAAELELSSHPAPLPSCDSPFSRNVPRAPKRHQINGQRRCGLRELADSSKSTWTEAQGLRR